MKTRIKLLFISLLFIIQACKIEEHCGECFSPPMSFIFELVDKTTGENLFTNETYLPEKIEVINTSDNTKIEYKFVAENGVNLISIYSIGWKTEKTNLAVKISGQTIFNLYVDAARVSENCCSFTMYNEIKIENTEYELNKSNGIYRILK